MSPAGLIDDGLNPRRNIPLSPQKFCTAACCARRGCTSRRVPQQQQKQENTRQRRSKLVLILYVRSIIWWACPQCAPRVQTGAYKFSRKDNDAHSTWTAAAVLIQHYYTFLRTIMMSTKLPKCRRIQYKNVLCSTREVFCSLLKGDAFSLFFIYGVLRSSTPVYFIPSIWRLQILIEAGIGKVCGWRGRRFRPNPTLLLNPNGGTAPRCARAVRLLYAVGYCADIVWEPPEISCLRKKNKKEVEACRN